MDIIMATEFILYANLVLHNSDISMLMSYQLLVKYRDSVKPLNEK